MKKYPSYTTLNSINNPSNSNSNGKKLVLLPKYEKPVSNITNVLNSVRNGNHNHNVVLKKKDSFIDSQLKKVNESVRKDAHSIVEKVKTQANQNKSSVSEKQDYVALKNRLHALEDRLVQIKKSYELRKNKSQHFSIQKFSPKFQNKQNQKIDKVPFIFSNTKKQLKLEVKSPLLQHQSSIQSRLAVQSPKAEPQQHSQSRIKVQSQPIQLQPQPQHQHHSQPSKPQPQCPQSAPQPVIAQYITQYQQKPIPFKHTTSQTNLLKSSIKQKISHHTNEQYYISSVIKAIQAEKPTSFDQLCTSHVIASYQFLCYIKNISLQKPKKPVIRTLPPPNKKFTVIFDLDQTLIHCVQSKKISTADITIAVQFPDKNKVNVGINIRPYTKQCLKQLSKYFQIMVFTASHANYANAIVDFLDPNKDLISQKYSRQNCHKTQQGFYVKDLRVVDRKLSNILLIDNAAYSYCFQPENGVPIVPFYDNKADLQLKNLIPYLKGFLNETDVRIKNNSIMKLSQYTKYKSPQDLITQLYK